MAKRNIISRFFSSLWGAKSKEQTNGNRQSDQVLSNTARESIAVVEVPLLVEVGGSKQKVHVKCELSKIDPDHYIGQGRYEKNVSGFKGLGYHFKVSFPKNSGGIVGSDLIKAMSLVKIYHPSRKHGEIFIINSEFFPARVNNQYAALARLSLWLEQYQPLEDKQLETPILNSSPEQSSATS
jgi:hypothetical protein